MKAAATLAAFLGMAGAAWGQSLLGGADASPYDPPKPRTYRVHDVLKIRLAETAGQPAVLVTAEVVDVRPNGRLVVQGRKRRKAGAVEEILRLTGEAERSAVTSGAVRFEDLMNVNLVLEGIAPEKPDPGFLSGLVLKAWPF